MRPDYKKWQKADKDKKPFQVALFIRTESGMTTECVSDSCTPNMKQAVMDALAVLSTGKWPDTVKETPATVTSTEQNQIDQLGWALSDLRHLYNHMVNGRVKDVSLAADGLLAMAIKRLEKLQQES